MLNLFEMFKQRAMERRPNPCRLRDTHAGQHNTPSQSPSHMADTLTVKPYAALTKSRPMQCHSELVAGYPSVANG